MAKQPLKGDFMRKENLINLAICIFICLLAGAIGSIFTYSAIPTWYAGLNKPTFNPPNWLFGPVWTLLYVLMGISLYYIAINPNKKERKIPMIIFGVQLGLNTLWSILFFGMHSPVMGFICIILLLISILASIILFYRVNKTAAYLLIPYILWVSFAAALNYAILLLNP